MAGNRRRRVHVDMLQILDGDRRERVQLRAEPAQGLQELRRLEVVHDHRRLDDDERATAKRLREGREGRELQEASDRGHLVGNVLGTPGYHSNYQVAPSSATGRC